MSSSPRYNRRKRGAREHSSYILVGNLPNNNCARPLERWLCDFSRSLRVGRCCRDGKSSESWSVRVYGDKNDLEQFAADYETKRTAFFDRHLTVSALIEPKHQKVSPQRQRYVWKYKNGQGRFSEYNNTVSSQIESLRAGERLDIPVGRNSYRVKRMDSTSGVQVDLRTKQEVPIVREGPYAPQPRSSPPNLMSDADVIQNLLSLDVNQPELTPAFWASLDEEKCATSSSCVSSLAAQKQNLVSRLIRVNLETNDEIQTDASILANRARDHFRASLSSIDYEIVSIKLCVNPFAFQQYQYFRRVRQRFAVEDLNERFLFHGTTDENVNGIVARGFLRDYGETEIFGHGCYFATTASGSVPYAPRDETGIQRLLWCIVVCGESCLGTSASKRPRCKANGFEFETMVQNFGRNDVIVVPNDHQAYPLAVIEFKSVRGSSVGSMENAQLSGPPPVPSTASPPLSLVSWQNSVPNIMNIPMGRPMMQATPMSAMGSVPMFSSVPTQPWIGAGMGMPFVVVPQGGQPPFLTSMMAQGPGSSVSVVPGAVPGGYGLYPANAPGAFSGHS